MIREYYNLGLIYKKTGERSRALLQMQKCLEAAKHKELELWIMALVERALILAEVNNAYDALNSLMQVEESQLSNFNSRVQARYFYAKGVVFCYFAGSLETGKGEIVDQIMSYLNRALEIYIRLGCLQECR